MDTDFVELYHPHEDSGDHRTCRLCGARVHCDLVHFHVESKHFAEVECGAAVRIGKTGRTWRVSRRLVRSA